jgi:high affinity Mn2+ porin
MAQALDPGIFMRIFRSHFAHRFATHGCYIQKIAGPAPGKSDRSWQASFLLAASILLASLAEGADIATAADLPVKAASVPYTGYDWTGAYVGGHVGYAWGKSDWSAGPGVAGSLDLMQPIDAFAEVGSFFAGLQAGYDKMLASRFVVGVVADVSFPSYPSPSGISIGGSSNLVSPLGLDTYSQTVLSFGTFRGRVGYAPGNWLFYATGGFAWTYDQMSLASASETPQLFRLGWAAGVGAEVSIGNNWTASLEYLYTSYNRGSVSFPSVGETFDSTSQMQEVRFGLNYHFGDGSKSQAESSAIAPDLISMHGQSTFVWQGYPTFNSPYAGPYSLPSNGTGKETFDTTLYAGIKLWQDAEFWFNPEVDQGYGVGDIHGLVGFPSGESYKLGHGYPYGRIQRAFLRQTINLGGESEKVDDDINQFAGTRSTDRLVLTVGRFGVNDIFDTNKYANNPKSDFLNWTLINTGTFDYGNDPWGSRGKPICSRSTRRSKPPAPANMVVVSRWWRRKCASSPNAVGPRRPKSRPCRRTP